MLRAAPEHRVACFAVDGERAGMSDAAARASSGRARPSTRGGLFSRRRIVAVTDVSFQLEARRPEIFTIIGESGSGKTTLARMILEYRDADKRQVRSTAMTSPRSGRRQTPHGVHAQGAADLPEPVRSLQPAEAAGSTTCS